jgi:hypothetical protein
LQSVNVFLTIKIEAQIALVRASLHFENRHDLAPSRAFYRSSLGDGLMPVGALWSNGMSGREVQAGNLLSAFALTIAGALGVGLPMALVIIWVCS